MNYKFTKTFTGCIFQAQTCSGKNLKSQKVLEKVMEKKFHKYLNAVRISHQYAVSPGVMSVLHVDCGPHMDNICHRFVKTKQM